MGNFKNIFKQLRIKSGFTQDTLSIALGISRSAVSMYENGNREPDFETLEKIADFFNVDMNYLLGHTETTTTLEKDEFTNIKEPTYKDIQSLVARNGKKLTIEQKQELIKTLLSDD